MAAAVALRWSPFGHEVLHKHLELGPTLKRQAIEWVSNATKLAMFCRIVTSDIIFSLKSVVAKKVESNHEGEEEFDVGDNVIYDDEDDTNPFPFH